MATTVLTPITASIPAFTVTPSINTTTFPEDIDQYNTEMPAVIAAQSLLGTQLNTFITQVGTLEANVSSLEGLTVSAAEIALAAANFKGTWSGATSYAVPSSVAYSNTVFIALQAGSNQTPNPLVATAYWLPISLAFQIHASTSKATPSSADEFGYYDSVTGLMAKTTYAQLLTSPALTGNPTAPNQSFGDNDTSIANTAFVQAAIGALKGAAPAGLDTLVELASAIGNDTSFATTVSTALGLKAPLASPIFTGDPKAPTPSAGDNDTSIATTEFVHSAIKNDLNISGTAPIFGVRAWANFNGVLLAGTYAQSGTTVTVNATAHGLSAGMIVNITISTGTAVSGSYTVVSIVSADSFTYTAGTSLTTSGNLNINTRLIASGNITSISRTAAGDYTLYFTTQMPDNYYSLSSMTISSTGLVSTDIVSLAVGSVRIGCVAESNGARLLQDRSLITIIVVR